MLMLFSFRSLLRTGRVSPGLYKVPLEFVKAKMMLDSKDLWRWAKSSKIQNLKPTVSIGLFGLRSTTTALIFS